jgi:tetratricopeptide (TPR) repeat protein
MSSLFYARKDYVKALEYNFTATKINEEIGDKTSLIINYVNMGSYFLEMSHDDKLKISTHDVTATTKQQKLDKAVDYLMRSIKISEEIGYLEGLKAARETLYEVYELQGNYKQALSNFKEMTNIIQNINKAFDHRIRLGIMSILMVYPRVCAKANPESSRTLNLIDRQLR